METWMIVASGLGVVILFVAFWCVTCSLISRSGWAGLAKEFATTLSPAGKRFRFVSALFRPLTSYKNSIRVTLTDAGIHLAVMPLFRVGHPPLLIPWQHVERYEEHKVLAYSKLRIEINAAGIAFDIMLPAGSKADVDAYLAKRGL